jgi:cell division protein FtsB
VPRPARSVRGYARAHVGGLTLTTRAALLGLALCAVVLTLAYPAREYLAQHRQINQLAQQVARDKANVTALKAAGLRDADPTYIENQARQRLHLQRPGDLVFQLPPAAPTKAGKQTAGAVRTPVLPGRGTQPWYSQLYRSTVESGK